MKVYDALYKTLWEMGLLNQVGQASGGSTTTVVDTALALTADTKIGGSILIFKTTDNLAPLGEIKRVTDNDTNTYTTEAFSAAVGAGDQYAYVAKDFNVYELIPAVNLALEQIGDVGLADESLSIVADQREYTLPAAVYAGRIRNVQLMTNTGDADDPDYVMMYGWAVVPGTSPKLKLDKQYEAGRTIRIEYIGAHPEITSFSDDILGRIHPNLFKHSLKFALSKSRNEEAIASQDGYRDLYNSNRDEWAEAMRKYPVKLPRLVVPARTFGRG